MRFEDWLKKFSDLHEKARSGKLSALDTRNYLGPLGDLILTGPTGTNVADIVALLATPAARKGYNARHLPGGAP